MKSPIVLLLLITSWISSICAQRQVCELYPLGNGLDDAPNILQAFDTCGVNGTVVFTNNTFNINTVLNTTNLNDCHIHIYGTLRWSTNITYWTSLRFPILFESLSTGWLLGGKDVKVHGYGYGTLDGQGQVWYDWNKNKTNKPGRPMALTVYNADNLVIRGLRIVQAQFWSMLISQSQNIVVTDMFINNVSNSTSTTVNTDGLDIWRSNNVTIQRWNVTCFDDAIAIKGNSSNVYVSDINAYRTTGFAIGSIGQYANYPEYVTNVTMERCTLRRGLSYGAFIKTWSGVTSGTPPNGGGGGQGHVQNVLFKDMTLECSAPIVVTQCTYYATKGDPHSCDTSKLKISNVTWQNIYGISDNELANVHCSGAVPCTLQWQNVTIVSSWRQGKVKCANILNQNIVGFKGANIPCNAWA